MSYSHKNWWLSKGASVAAPLVGFALVFALHPSRTFAGLILLAFSCVGLVLGMRAFFYRDEIEQQNRMRCWYFGSMLGLAISVVGMLCIFFFGIPSDQAIVADLFHNHAHRPYPLFFGGYLTGLFSVVVAQVVGSWLAQAVMTLRPAR